LATSKNEETLPEVDGDRRATSDFRKLKQKKLSYFSTGEGRRGTQPNIPSVV